MSTRFKLASRPLAIAGLALCVLLQACDNKGDANPASTAMAADAPVLSVPLQRNQGWLVEAQSADNKPHRVLLDTGATTNIMDSEGPLAAAPITPQAEAGFLRQGTLNVPSTDGAITADTASDPVQIKLGLGPALRIQGWAIPAGTLTMRSDLARLSAVTDTPFEAIIGNENMRQLTWRADYVTGRLTAWANKAPAHDWQQCTFMTLNTNARTPNIELKLGNESNFFMVDTGDNGDISLPQPLFDSLADAKVFERITTSFTYDVSDRFLPSQTGLLAGLSIGQKALPKLRVSGGSATLRLGMGLLEKMDRFEIDLRNYRFCFDLPSVPRDSTLSTMGAALHRSGERYEVAALAPHGRLDASGIKIGDQIATVDQTSVATLKLSRLIELLGAATTTQVTVQRGGRTLVIKLKPA